MIPVNALFQGEHWTDRHGTVHRIEEMPRRYCRNVIRYLERNAEPISWAVGLTVLAGPRPSGDAANDAFDAMLAELDEEPREWLYETTLMQALRRRLGVAPFFEGVRCYGIARAIGGEPRG